MSPHRPWFLLSAAAIAGFTAGCLNPQATRLPSIYSGEERAERRDLERHDPFPSNSAGPQTFTRPQGHVDQRTDLRRTKEEALLRGMNRNGTSAPPSSRQDPYPDTVRE